jgi:hypothetical protein
MYWGFGLLPGTSKKWKVRPIPSSAGNAQNTTLIPSKLLGIFGADSIPSILLGYQQVAIPSTLLGYLI